MATISPVGSWIAKGVHRTLWETLTTSGDTVNPASEAQLPDKTVEVKGTFASATITLVGSNDPTPTGTYETLNDASSTPLTFTADGIQQVLENPRFIKPIASGATGGTDVDIVLVSHGDPR